MIFDLDANHMELASPAQYPQNQNTKLVQAKERTATGVTHVEDFSVRIGTYTYNFVDMSQDDYVLLMDWFVNISEGMVNSFYLTDDFGIERLVRFTTATLSFTNTSYIHWNGSFTVEVVQ